VETVLTIAIVGVLALVVAPTLISTVSHFSLISGRRATITDAKVAMDRMMIEMRLIPDTNNITAFSASSITFNTPSESGITYALNGSDLQRNGVNLLSNVSSLAFTYLDANGAATAVKANIKRIGVELLVNAATGSGTFRLRSQVFPRRFSTGYGGYQ
jgi:type II secretory pathway pseudopilin PulG